MSAHILRHANGAKATERTIMTARAAKSQPKRPQLMNLLAVARVSFDIHQAIPVVNAGNVFFYPKTVRIPSMFPEFRRIRFAFRFTFFSFSFVLLSRLPHSLDGENSCVVHHFRVARTMAAD